MAKWTVRYLESVNLSLDLERELNDLEREYPPTRPPLILFIDNTKLMICWYGHEPAMRHVSVKD